MHRRFEPFNKSLTKCGPATVNAVHGPKLGRIGLLWSFKPGLFKMESASIENRFFRL